MSSVWNNRISVSIFGESHGPAIGVVIDNLPAGENIDVNELMKFLARRAPKNDGTTTNRKERRGNDLWVTIMMFLPTHCPLPRVFLIGLLA